MATIVALAGRRIDPPHAKTTRFPARNIERVRNDICRELKNQHAQWLVSSAAAGADLLAVKAAIDLGIASRIVLSPGVREFEQMSVEDRGSYWTQEFENAISAIVPENIACIPAEPDVADTFRMINERILSDAVAFSVSRSAKLVCVAVWDGVRRGKDDFSADFVERAVTRGLPVTHISTV
jgi:hypothetical protein